jgi:hypothetical protein
MLTAQATIYGADVDADTPCSSEVLQFPQIATCYNTSWVYYSIDACTPPSSSSSSPTTLLPSSSSTSTAPPSPSPPDTVAIAGGAVGAVCGLAVLASIIFLFLRRNRKRRQQQQPPRASSNALAELLSPDVKHEIYTHETVPQELGGIVFISRLLNFRVMGWIYDSGLGIQHQISHVISAQALHTPISDTLAQNGDKIFDTNTNT